MAKRFNVYLDSETEALFNYMKDCINNERDRKVSIMKDKQSVNLCTAKPVGNSELIQDLIKKSYKKEKEILVDEIDELSRIVDIKSEKLKKLNGSTLWDTSAEKEANKILI